MKKSREDLRNKLRDDLLDLLVESADEEDKPIPEALRYYSKISDLSSRLLNYVKDALGNTDKSVSRERAVRVNAVFAPIIDALEQFLNENV